MQFKHPEILYALFALIIPIIIHLFQLRKFKKTAFTNVAFLKKIKVQTRKSSQIKKWLLLITRLALITCIILAFAQPFLPATTNATKAKQTVIYLDNSHSMQLKGSNGSLLTQAVQELIKHIPKEQEFTLVTNDNLYPNIRIKTHRNELLNIGYSPNQLNPNAIQLKTDKFFSKNVDFSKQLIYISDFQKRYKTPLINTKNSTTYAVRLTPTSTNNISIDSVFIKHQKQNQVTLTLKLSATNTQEKPVSIAIKNGEKLLAKANASFTEKLENQIDFDISTTKAVTGEIIIEDNGLRYDNKLYFSLNNTVQIPVLSITEGDDSFLRKIYTAPEFRFTSTPLNKLNYSTISDYNLIVLNELKKPTLALINALKSFSKQGGTLLIIPSKTQNLEPYAQLYNALAGVTIADYTDQKHKITAINFDHPIYQNVFKNRITNFQFPSVQSKFNIRGGDPILKFADNTPFLVNTKNTFAFSAAINIENSNFTKAPLIVPTLYKIGKNSLKSPQLYYTINQQNSFTVSNNIPNDNVISLTPVIGKGEPFIPLQQKNGNHTTITTDQLPEQDGVYQLIHNQNILQEVSYNFNRKESFLNYHTLSSQNDLKVYNTVAGLFEQLTSENHINFLWKWFIIFALIFIAIEILILKYIK